MENFELKKVRIKNRTFYYLYDTIKLEDFNCDNILIDEKSHENILIYGIAYKTLIGPKPLRIRFDKIDGFITIYDRTKYLKLFHSEKYDAIYNKIRYLTSLKRRITDVFSRYYSRNKVDFYHSLTIEKLLTLRDIVILIKSVLNKDKSHCYCKIVLEKCTYQLAKK